MATQELERQELKKAMGVFDYFTMGFGAMVGVGWVITVGDWILKAGGPLGAVIAFILGGIILLPVGYSMSELCACMPVAGGELAFAYRAFGTRGSFMTGWFLCLSFTILCPWEAIAIPQLVGSLIPALDFGTLYSVNGYPIKWPLLIIGLAVAILIILLNIAGVDKSAKFQTIMTNLLLTCSGIFILTGLIKGEAANLMPLWGPSVGYDLSQIGGMLAVFAISPFFFSGFDTIPQAAEEAGENTDHGKMGKTITMVIISGIFFYCLCILSVASLVPWHTLADMSFPAADALLHIAPIIGKIVLIGALLGLVTTFNAFFLASTRLLFSMGRARMIPQWFAQIDPKTNSPINAVYFVGIITVVGPFIGKSLLLPLVNVGTLGFVVAWGMVAASSVVLRKQEPDMVRPYQMPGGIVCGYLAVASCLLVILLLLVPGSPAMLVWPLEWVITVAWVVLGLLFFSGAAKTRSEITEEQRKYLIFGDNVKTQSQS